MGELVSIIMPSFNASMFIKETIESVLAQIYSNWELIIVNDCSKDNTVEVIGKYADVDSRIRFYRRHQDRGDIQSYRELC